MSDAPRTWADILAAAIQDAANIGAAAGRGLEWGRKKLLARAEKRALEHRLGGVRFWDSARMGPAVRVGTNKYAPSHQYTPHPDNPKKRGTWTRRKPEASK